MGRMEMKDRLEKFCHDIETNIMNTKEDLEELEYVIEEYDENSDYTTARILVAENNFYRIRTLATEALEMIRSTE